MADHLQPDLCVIGGTPAGRAIAIAAAAGRMQAVMIVPADANDEARTARTAMVEASRRVHLARNGVPLGVSAEAMAGEFEAMRIHVRNTLAALAPNDSVERLAGLGVRVITGEARFTGADSLTIDDRFEIKAKHFVIATQSVPALPQIAGLDGAPYLTTETVLELSACPDHLLVIGASAAGLELAQAFRRFGAAVTVIDSGPVLPDHDIECVRIMLRQLELEGISLHLGRAILSVKGGSGVEVTLQSASGPQTLAGSHLLVATGRRPAIDGLGLDKAGLALDSGGRVVVDKSLRSENPKVYAIGNAAAGFSGSAAAQYHAGLLIESLFLRRRAVANPDIVPKLVLTDPELAQVGLDETRSKERHKALRLLRWPFYENERAQAEGDTTGHVKIVTNAAGLVLGATIVGRGAGDQIAIYALPLAQGAHIAALTKAVLPVPTRAEAAMHAAAAFFVPGLTIPWWRRIMGLLRRSG